VAVGIVARQRAEQLETLLAGIYARLIAAGPDRLDDTFVSRER
jgi:hypothetical protein